MVSFIKKFFICLMCCASPLMGMHDETLVEYLKLPTSNVKGCCKDIAKALEVAVKIFNTNEELRKKAFDELNKEEINTLFGMSTSITDALRIIENLPNGYEEIKESYKKLETDIRAELKRSLDHKEKSRSEAVKENEALKEQNNDLTFYKRQYERNLEKSESDLKDIAIYTQELKRLRFISISLAIAFTIILAKYYFK
jgi:hypothetical protein